MADVGGFLANMLLGGLTEGQRRQQSQEELVKTVLPHLLTLEGTRQYRQSLLDLKQQEVDIKRRALSQKLEGLPDAQFIQLGKSVDARRRSNRWSSWFGGQPSEQDLLVESLYQSELERRVKRTSDFSTLSQQGVSSSDPIDFALESAANANP